MEIPPTDYSLLLALQSESPAKREGAWARFEPRYHPVIIAWCLRRELLLETAEELTQEILLKLSVKFLQHCYDSDTGLFRNWLKAVVGNAVRDYQRQQQQRDDKGAVGGTDHWHVLAELATPEAADQLSNALTNQPVTRAAQALARVRGRVPEIHWNVFILHHVDGRTGSEIATELGLGVANVHKILQRIKKQLEEEIGHD